MRKSGYDNRIVSKKRQFLGHDKSVMSMKAGYFGHDAQR